MLRMLVLLAFAALLAPSPAAVAARPDTARVRLGSGAGAPEAFVAYPPGELPAPAVIVAHEWWGLNHQIRDLARRLARQGYVVIVPDLYGGRVAKDAEAAHVLARSVEEERANRTFDQAARWLRSQPRTAKSRIGVVGFCMGGSLALGFAMSSDVTAAVVMFYGRPETRAERVAKLNAPLQAHFGATDDGIASDRVEAFRSALGKAGKVHELHVYAGAGHAFMNEERRSHKPDAARLAWVRMLAFLQKHLKG